jgi:hypothetical protein
MKNFIIKNFLCGLALMAFVLVIDCLPENSQAQTSTVPATVESSASSSSAPVAPPPLFAASSPFGQVVRLTQANVDQSIILTYVTNSSSTFNLDSDKIIYLSNLGVPPTLVTAMMRRDEQLQQQFTAAQTAQQIPQTTPAPAVPASEAPPAETADVVGQSESPAPVTLDYFNDSLAPYGSWVVVNGYGRCWRPTVVAYDSNWQPYCDNGYWAYTDCGWYWNSTYAWGATFHYGRWFRNAGLGWCWYPGTVWAPSWVTWRYSNNYCGWAPLPPHTTYQAGVGIVYNGGNVSIGFGFGLGASCFTFVPTQYFCNPHPRNYCVARTQVALIYNHTTPVNNYNVHGHVIVNHGIAVQNIAAATRTPIHPVPVHQLDNSFAHGYRGQSFEHSGHMPENHHTTMGNPHAWGHSDGFSHVAPATSYPGQYPSHSAVNYNGPGHDRAASPSVMMGRQSQPQISRNYVHQSQSRLNVTERNQWAAPRPNYFMPAPPRTYGQPQYAPRQNYYSHRPAIAAPPSIAQNGWRGGSQNWRH